MSHLIYLNTAPLFSLSAQLSACTLSPCAHYIPLIFLWVSENEGRFIEVLCVYWSSWGHSFSESDRAQHQAAKWPLTTRLLLLWGNSVTATNSDKCCLFKIPLLTVISASYKESSCCFPLTLTCFSPLTSSICFGGHGFHCKYFFLFFHCVMIHCTEL